MSDVIGSILLVGITVVMAAGFGALLLSYDGPVDQLHAQLAVTVGPGPDGDWGANDAELTLQHLGGEPLRDQSTVIRYRDAAGTTTTLAHGFPGGDLAVGESWTGTISANAGEAIQIDVVVAHTGGASLISSGTASAGGATAFLTYVSTITAASGWGSVTSPGNAGAANDNLDASLIEGAVGGTPTTIAMKPSTGTATSSGASNANIKLDDNNRAALDTALEYVQGNVFSNNPSGVVLSDITVGFQGRGTRTCQAIAHQASVSSDNNGGGTSQTLSVTVPTIVNGHAYLAAIASGNTGTAPDVDTVTGLGVTWTQVGEVSNAAGTSRIEVWVGLGSTSIIGTVQAHFTAGYDRAAIVVSRYSNVDYAAGLAGAVHASTTGTATGTTMSTTGIAGLPTTSTGGGETVTGLFYAAANAVAGSGVTWTTPATEEREEDLNSRVRLSVADATAAATNVVSATVGGGTSQPWQAIALTLKPTCTAYTTAKVSYMISGVDTGSTQTFQLTGTDAEHTLNVISDRTWAIADLANLGVRVTLPATVSGSTADVDLVYITLTTADALTQYRSDFELQFNSVPGGATTEVVQLRYRTNGADSFVASIWTGTAWRACPGLLNAVSYAVFACAAVLTSPSEHQATDPNIRLRIQDSTPAGTTRATLLIDYARVATA